MKREATYFTCSGEKNTENTLLLARESVLNESISRVIIASTSGDTAFKAVEKFRGLNVELCIVGIGSLGWCVEPEKSKKLTEAGAKLFPCKNYLNDSASNALRWLGEGMKVAAEIARVVNDNKALNNNERAIVIAGTNEGSDTAVIIKTFIKDDRIDFKICEILCKPLFI